MATSIPGIRNRVKNGLTAASMPYFARLWYNKERKRHEESMGYHRNRAFAGPPFMELFRSLVKKGPLKLTIESSFNAEETQEEANARILKSIDADKRGDAAFTTFTEAEFDAYSKELLGQADEILV
jgi:hypothetical protein